MDPEAQTQVAEPELAPPAEDTEPQQTAETEAPAPGAEPGKTSDTPPAKSYSEEDVRKRETELRAKTDKEIAEAREAMARLNMQRQLEALQHAEARAAADDARAIANGQLTPEQADANRVSRQQAVQQRMEQQRIREETERSSRVIAVQHIVDQMQKEYEDTGVQFRYSDFLADQNLKTPADVMAKGLRLVNAKLKQDLQAAKVKPETYDKGPSSAGAADVFTGTVTEAQLEDDAYWEKHKKKILEYQRSGRLVVKQ